MNTAGSGIATSFLRRVLNIAYVVGVVCFFLLLLGCVISVIAPSQSQFDLAEMGLLLRVESPRLKEIIRIQNPNPVMGEAQPVTLVDVHFRSASRRFTLLMSVMILFLVGIFLYILKLLRDIFNSISHGSPFIRDNARRIRNIGWLMIAAQVMILFWGAGLLWIFQIPVTIPDVQVSVYWYPLVEEVQGALKGIFAGIIVLVIADIYRIGVEMKEERELTV